MSGIRRREALRRAERAMGLAGAAESITVTTSLDGAGARAARRIRGKISRRQVRWLGGAVEAGGAQGVAGPGGVGEAGSSDEGLHLRGAGEALDRVRQVRVCRRVSRDDAAERGQDAVEVEGVEPADEAAWMVEFEDGDLAAGAQHAVELGEAVGVAGEVAEAEGGGDERTESRRVGEQRVA